MFNSWGNMCTGSGTIGTVINQQVRCPKCGTMQPMPQAAEIATDGTVASVRVHDAPKAMESLTIIEGINEAIKVLAKASKANANGALTIWQMTDHAQTHLDKQIAELLAPEPEAPKAESVDVAPTAEEWRTIAEVIESYAGMPTTLEGGGAGCPFITIELPDGRVGILGDINETWMVDLYPDKDHTCMVTGEGPMQTLDLGISTDFTGIDREYNLNPERIATELLSVLRDVCIAGEPAILGRCGDPECVCHPKDSAEDRTRTGNTPTCEDCDHPQDGCTCEEDQAFADGGPTAAELEQEYRDHSR